MRLRLKLEQAMTGKKEEAPDTQGGSQFHFLRRQSNPTGGCSTNGGRKCTIHATFGGGMMDCFPFPSLAKREIQQRFVDAGDLDRVERAMVLVQKKLHPFAPGTKSVLRTDHAYSIWYCQFPDFLMGVRKPWLERNHDFPLFCGAGGNWWYVGHYQVDWGGTEHNGEIRTMTDAECRGCMGDNYVFKMLVEASANAADDYSEAWVDLCSARDCKWNTSLTTLQEDLALIIEKDKLTEITSALLKKYDTSTQRALMYLHERKMLQPKSGTDAQRKEAMRHCLNEGIIYMKRTWIKFVRFDEKLHRLLQNRCAGVNSKGVCRSCQKLTEERLRKRVANVSPQRRKQSKESSSTVSRKRRRRSQGSAVQVESTARAPRSEKLKYGWWKGEVEVNHVRGASVWGEVTREGEMPDFQRMAGDEIAKWLD